ncbi:hypothetical protein KY290_021258 [Solanum tuberosum]|uniref:CCHC-type domain-containing protein n=1 Tax=Solanum tuberosum TaxID=4113 RepID=A0ABQ7V441_SOLTU|nr:hypothetical protein KY289_020429 [Solanum tuberosum]KAH0757765.1 hypothetical protein KY290_021258 [Solanum tuberosum]
MTVLASEFLHIVTHGAKSHANVVVRHSNKHAQDYCSSYYSNKKFQDSYAIPIEPLPCESNWKVPSHVLQDIVLPPDVRKLPGRPPSYDRKKGFNEVKFKRSKVTCSRCGTEGHNKKTCHKYSKEN